MSDLDSLAVACQLDNEGKQTLASNHPDLNKVFEITSLCSAENLGPAGHCVPRASLGSHRICMPHLVIRFVGKNTVDDPKRGTY